LVSPVLVQVYCVEVATAYEQATIALPILEDVAYEVPSVGASDIVDVERSRTILARSESVGVKNVFIT
jgi:hypothetical protein